MKAKPKPPKVIIHYTGWKPLMMDEEVIYVKVKR